MTQNNLASTIEPGLLTLRQAASRCGVSERALWGWARSGASPAPLKIGKGTVRYSKPAYVEWIKAGCPRIDGGQGRE